MQELNFEDNYEQGYTDIVKCLDELTYSCIEYNVADGMSWESVAQLFGEDTTQAAMARYEMAKCED